MWLQVMEMLRIEKGGAEQVAGELETYNPLIPQGRELIATLMLEIEDAGVRDAHAAAPWAASRKPCSSKSARDRIKATPTEYEDRTTPDGKTSSVHWLRFSFTPEQIARVQERCERVVLGIGHTNYGHMAVLARRGARGAGEGFRLSLFNRTAAARRPAGRHRSPPAPGAPRRHRRPGARRESRL